MEDTKTPEHERAPKHFGVHLTVDGYGGRPDLLESAENVRSLLYELPTLLEMQRLHEPTLLDVPPLTEKDPGGISGFVVVAESHISLHTFPNRSFVSADVYTCKETMDTERVITYFKEHFALADVETNFIVRGTRYPQHNN